MVRAQNARQRGLCRLRQSGDDFFGAIGDRAFEAAEGLVAGMSQHAFAARLGMLVQLVERE